VELPFYQNGPRLPHPFKALIEVLSLELDPDLAHPPMSDGLDRDLSEWVTGQMPDLDNRASDHLTRVSARRFQELGRRREQWPGCGRHLYAAGHATWWRDRVRPLETRCKLTDRGVGKNPLHRNDKLTVDASSDQGRDITYARFSGRISDPLLHCDQGLRQSPGNSPLGRLICDAFGLHAGQRLMRQVVAWLCQWHQ
jgi:hypothetical protein